MFTLHPKTTTNDDSAIALTAPKVESRTIWMDGSLVPWGSAQLHVLAHGLHYASAVWEGLRVYDGTGLLVREHSARLFRSASLLGLEIPFSVAEVVEAIELTVAASQIAEGYVRPIVWRGSGDIGLAGSGAAVNVAIACVPWLGAFSATKRERGISLSLSRWRRPSPDSAPSMAKTSGVYAICSMSKREAEREGCDDALMLDFRDFVAEATAANIFFVEGERLVTPTADCFLDGITRRTVMALARSSGIEICEDRVTLERLLKADEVFLTGTAYEIQPVSCIGEREITPGPVTRRIRDMYSRFVASEYSLG